MAEIVIDGVERIVVEQIHRNKASIPGSGGVYVIVSFERSGEIEYIGQSACLRQRLLAHQMCWARIPYHLSGWDAIFYLIDDEQKRKATEKRLIRACNPALNVVYNGGR